MEFLTTVKRAKIPSPANSLRRISHRQWSPANFPEQYHIPTRVSCQFSWANITHTDRGLRPIFRGERASGTREGRSACLRCHLQRLLRKETTTCASSVDKHKTEKTIDTQSVFSKYLFTNKNLHNICICKVFTFDTIAW